MDLINLFLNFYGTSTHHGIWLWMFICKILHVHFCAALTLHGHCCERTKLFLSSSVNMLLQNLTASLIFVTIVVVNLTTFGCAKNSFEGDGSAVVSDVLSNYSKFISASLKYFNPSFLGKLWEDKSKSRQCSWLEATPLVWTVDLSTNCDEDVQLS